jgi:hypothetical protein
MGIVTNTKVAVVGLFAVGFAVSEGDKKLNYIETDAVVTSAKVDCFVKNGKNYVESKSTKQMAYMDCEMAPYAAAEFGFKDTDISKHTKLAFTYKSPVDGSKQTGEKEDDYIQYKIGQKIKIYAHKSDPKKMRL